MKELRTTVPESLQEFIAALSDRYTGKLRVAVSGGADSVLLLHVLHRAGLAATVLHVNHKLRGHESDADQAFVEALASNLGLPFLTATLPPAPGNLEQEARTARYLWFRDGGQFVATGHTLDDQAETVLSRFLRGAGTAGLAGVLRETNGIVRPLLAVPRETVRAWLHELNVTWREDSSNADHAFLRNRIRHEILPALCEINPALPTTLSATAEWAHGEEQYWVGEMDRLAALHLAQRGETVLISAVTLRELPVAVQRRLLRRAVEIVRGGLRGINFRHTEAIRALTETREGSGRLQLPGLDVYRSFDWLRLSPLGFDNRLPRDFEAPLAVPGRTFLPERNLTVTVELSAANRVYNSDLHALDPAKLTGTLLLRNWRPGDAIRLLSGSSAVKMKTLFQEHRIPLWERRAWPVVVSGNDVVWTRLFGVAQDFGAEPGCVAAVVRDGIE